MHYPAKKSLGQHFMTDRNMTRKIINAIDPRPGEHIVEIGPGRGALTEELLQSGCRLTLMELDTTLAAMWKAREREYPNLRCIEGNALTTDWNKLLPLDKLCGNIPYNISRALMYKIFSYHRQIPEALLIVQKEFAEKLTAKPASPAFNTLSVLTQLLYDAALLFLIPKEVFSPMPGVASAGIRLRLKRTKDDIAALETIVQKAFLQRRKKLRNSLKDYYSPELEHLFSWDERADTIGAEQYEKLYNLLKTGALKP